MNICHALNPFNPLERKFYFAPDEYTIDEFIAKNQIDILSRPTVCIVNGDQGVLKADFNKRLVSEFDTMVFVTLPEGGGGGSNPLKLIATIALVTFAPGLAGGFGSLFSGGAFGAGFAAGQAGLLAGTAFGIAKAAVMIGGMALINALIPPPKPPSPQQQSRSQSSPVYSLQAQGNSARIDSAIPEIFGTHRVYPDFAAQPYTEYNGNEQYLYQLLCIGVGEYQVNDIRIEDTAISNFEEITYELVEPNNAVTLFPTNVETSPEVSGQELLKNSPVGGFIANASGTLANAIGVDIVCPKGLFYANDEGGLDARSVSFIVEARTVDDTGTPTSAYTTIGTHTINGATVTPIRKSYRYSVSNGRYQVKVTRTSSKSNDTRVGNDLNWEALRAYIPGSQNYGNATMLAIRARATNNLSGTSSRKINVSVTRKIKSWNSSTGWDANPSTTHASKPAWVLAYICSQVLPESRYSLLSLEALQTTIDARNAGYAQDDEFNGVFDNKMTLWEALQLVAKCVRAMPIIQGGVVHFIRDEAQTVPTALFSMRNIVKGSFKNTYILPGEETADSIEVEYFDSDSLKPQSVLCELDPGNSVTTAKVKLFGVTKRDHAYREGMYHAAANKYRRIMTTFDTELEGYIPMVGDLVAVVHDSPNWGQSGEVVAYETYATIYWKITLSEPLTEGVGQHYIIFRDKDGSPTTAIACTVDAVDKTIVTLLKADLTITLNPGNLGYEPTHFAFGVASEVYQKCRVIPPIKPKGENIVELNVVNEVDAVHTADGGTVPALDQVFDLPAPIVKPVINSLNVTIGGTTENPKLALSWTPASEADHYVIEWRVSGDLPIYYQTNMQLLGDLVVSDVYDEMYAGYDITAGVWTRAGESTTNNYLLSVIPTMIDVRVAAVGLVQGDWVSTTVNAELLPTPGTVKNLRLSDGFGSGNTFGGTEAQIEWDKTARADTYKIEVWANAELRRIASTKDLFYKYRAEYAEQDGGVTRTLTFRVWGVNQSGQSLNYSEKSITNPAPPEMTGVNFYSGYKSIVVTYDAVQDTDFAGVIIWASQTQGFTPTTNDIIYKGKDRIITLPNLTELTDYYFRIAAYDEFGEDNLNISTTEYTAQTAYINNDLVPSDVLAALNDSLNEDGDGLILSGNKFAIQLTDGETRFPFIVANLNGQDYVGISADTVIEGTLSADNISTGSLSAGTNISLGDGSIILDGSGAITIYDGDSSVQNRDFAFLSNGELSFQQYWNGAYHEYKAVKRVEHGSADSGTTVTLPGYWKTQPKIIVTPNQLESYDVTYTAQSQKWHVLAENVRQDPAGSGIFKFDAIAELILSANFGVDNINQSQNNTTDSWSSSTYTLPANTSEIKVTVNVSSKRGTGLDSSQWYYRKVSWRVHYHDTVGDTWYQSAWQDVEFGANIDYIIQDDLTIALPANVTEYYVEFSASDVDGTAFNTGVTNYEYLTEYPGAVSTSRNYSDTYPWGYEHFVTTATLPAYSAPIGWEIYQVDYFWTWVIYWVHRTYTSTQYIYLPNRTISYVSYQAPIYCGDAVNGVHYANATETKSVTTTSYNRTYISIDFYAYLTNWQDYTCAPAAMGNYGGRTEISNAYAHVKLRKPILNSSTSDNYFELVKTNWTLSGTSAIAEGSLNYMAVEG